MLTKTPSELFMLTAGYDIYIYILVFFILLDHYMYRTVLIPYRTYLCVSKIIKVIIVIYCRVRHRAF
jgi:hypothetical protein